ncbi:pseudouridine synthase [Alphaproteobacteria bacterium]|nr:pseudouridine synthase [Alphaproteobacteria bacterium]GHT00036.1 pseudouridine synthase [Alphaproteobacteria bacterium]
MPSFLVPPHLNRARLDIALSEGVPCSRSHAQHLIRQGLVFCNGQKILKAKQSVFESDELIFEELPSYSALPQPVLLPLDILFEDASLIVLNKPAGLVVHPAPGHVSHTLVNALLAHCEVRSVGDPFRPGIVHRLDKDTSGLLLIAKTPQAHAFLSEQFRPQSKRESGENGVQRTYVGFVYGIPRPASGVLETFIARHAVKRKMMCVPRSNETAPQNKGENSRSRGRARGRLAITLYETKKTWPLSKIAVSCVEFVLKTGRTHQIRVHSQFMKAPLIGDPVYTAPLNVGKEDLPECLRTFPRQALHAKKIRFLHPTTHEKMEFEAALPDDLQRLREQIEHLSQEGLG